MVRVPADVFTGQRDFFIAQCTVTVVAAGLVLERPCRYGLQIGLAWKFQLSLSIAASSASTL